MAFPLFQLTFGGIQLDVPTPEIIARVSAVLWQDYLQETQPRRSYPGKNMQALATPFPGWPPRPFLNLGDFFYPTGVSRWAEYHGVATLQQLNAIYGQPGGISLPPTGATSGTFTIADDGSTDPNPNPNVLSPGISTTMYLLPPRPLSQVLDNVQNDLYLITLVDERYYFATRTYSLFGDQVNDKQWTDLFTSLTSDLGITLTLPANYAAHVVPTYGLPQQRESSFWASYESTPALLDAAAWNVGGSIRRNLNGTYNLDFLTDTITNSPDTPFTDLPTLYPRPVAGGSILWQPTFGGTLLGAGSVIPATVRVVFPFYLEQVGYVDPRHFIPNVPFNSLREIFNIDIQVNTLPNPYGQYTGKGIAVIRDTARAYFPTLSASLPDNDSQLQTLANQLAEDFCANLLLAYDVTLPHIVFWQPETFHDVIWTLRSDFASTRIFRKPWNFEAPEMQHYFTAASTDLEGPNAQPGTQVLDLIGSPDPSNYNRYTAQLARWSNVTQGTSDWKAAFAFQVANNQTVGHWIGNDPSTGKPVYAFASVGSGSISISASCYIALSGASPTEIIWKGFVVNTFNNVDNLQFDTYPTGPFVLTALSPLCSDPGFAHQGVGISLNLNSPNSLIGSCYISIFGNKPAEIIWKGFVVNSVPNVDNLQFNPFVFRLSTISPNCSDPGFAHVGVNVSLAGSCYITFGPPGAPEIVWTGFDVTDGVATFVPDTDKLQFDYNFFKLTIISPACSDPTAPHEGVLIQADLTKSGWFHNLLSVTHPDTVPFTPPGPGDLIIGGHPIVNKWQDFPGNGCNTLLYLAENNGVPYWKPSQIYGSVVQLCSETPGTDPLIGPEPVIAFHPSCYITPIVQDIPSPNFKLCDPTTYGWLCVSMYWKGFFVGDGTNEQGNIDEVDFNPNDFDIAYQASRNCSNDGRDGITYQAALISSSRKGCQIPGGWVRLTGFLTIVTSINFDSNRCVLAGNCLCVYMCNGVMYGPPGSLARDSCVGLQCITSN